jgi:hypothetical protein
MLCAFASQKAHVRGAQAFYEQASEAASHSRKDAANELVRTLVTAELEPLIRAQISKAKGISHLVIRNKTTGKFERVTDRERIVAVLNGGKNAHEVWEIWTRDPDTGAFRDLMNCALGKPKETLEVENKTDWDAFRVRIAEARKRLGAKD